MKKLLLLLTLTTLSLYAQTFNVSTTPELRTALETSATNGEDDTIILADGTYKTTDDGGGTFIYLSNEANTLTLVGSNSANVILSGDNIEQIFNHQSTEDAPLSIEKLTFMDGNNTLGNGGGIETDYSIDVADCNFTNNSASSSGAGFFSYAPATVTNSTFTDNSASSGAGFSSYAPATVTNSTFTGNSASSGAGFISYSGTTIVENSIFKDNYSVSSLINGGRCGGFKANDVVVINSTFINNSSETSSSGSVYGGGFCSIDATVENSIFIDNNASDMAGGFYSSSVTVTNSIFTNNNANDGGGFYSSSSLKATNLLLANNSSGIYLKYGETNIITNSIFVNNNNSDINSSSTAIIDKLNNNYLDINNVNVSNFKSGNIFDGVTLGFVDEANGDYTLTSSSDLIDAGTTDLGTFSLPETDMDGNARLVGGSVDIGPYEFSTTRPTISSITYSGIAKEQSELTFTTDYILSDGRALIDIAYDYVDDGTWSSLDTHTFATAGTYKVNVKVTDSEGEFSIGLLSITVSALEYVDMTDDQKLIATIDPTYYDDIMAIITAKEDSANASGITVGENNVVLSPSSYGLVDELDIVLISSSIVALEMGWTLTSSPFEITDLSIFDSASLVWIYDNSTSAWSAYSSDSTTQQSIIDNASVSTITTIPAGSGIWIQK